MAVIPIATLNSMAHNQVNANTIIQSLIADDGHSLTIGGNTYPSSNAGTEANNLAKRAADDEALFNHLKTHYKCQLAAPNHSLEPARVADQGYENFRDTINGAVTIREEVLPGGLLGSAGFGNQTEASDDSQLIQCAVVIDTSAIVGSGSTLHSQTNIHKLTAHVTDALNIAHTNLKLFYINKIMQHEPGLGTYANDGTTGRAAEIARWPSGEGDQCHPIYDRYNSKVESGSATVNITEPVYQFTARRTTAPGDTSSGIKSHVKAIQFVDSLLTPSDLNPSKSGFAELLTHCHRSLFRPVVDAGSTTGFMANETAAHTAFVHNNSNRMLVSARRLMCNFANANSAGNTGDLPTVSGTTVHGQTITIAHANALTRELAERAAGSIRGSLRRFED